MSCGSFQPQLISSLWNIRRLFHEEKRHGLLSQQPFSYPTQFFDLSVDLFFECFTSLEDRCLARGKLHGLAGRRITALTGIALLDRECTEAEKCNRLSGGDSVSNGIQHAVNNSGSLLLGKCILSGNFLNEF